MARQEQDNLTHPAGVPQNGNFPPGMSPQGSARSGSPNPNDPQRGESASCGLSRAMSWADMYTGSPTPGGSLMDPNNMPPQMRAQMQMMGANGQMMRPPSSHPAANLTPAHMEIMRQGGMQMPNGQFAPGQQPPQGMMPGGQPGQPGQGPQGTPRQANNQMPPPPAPAANASGGPSSPSQQPAPPTPSTTNKAKPGNKKEANKKVSKLPSNVKAPEHHANISIGLCSKERRRGKRYGSLRSGTTNTYTCDPRYSYEREILQQHSAQQPTNAKRCSSPNPATSTKPSANQRPAAARP